MPVIIFDCRDGILDVLFAPTGIGQQVADDPASLLRAVKRRYRRPELVYHFRSVVRHHAHASSRHFVDPGIQTLCRALILRSAEQVQDNTRTLCIIAHRLIRDDAAFQIGIKLALRTVDWLPIQPEVNP